MKFLLAFILFFATALFAVDQFYCPMRCEGAKTYEKAGTCPACHMELVKVPDTEDENYPLNNREIRLDFESDPATPKPGELVRLNFTPFFTKDNQRIRSFDDFRGADMEVYMTNQDLTSLTRVRPVLLANGTFSIKHTFQSGGNFLFFSVFTPKGKHLQVFPVALKVAGKPYSTVVSKTGVSTFGDELRREDNSSLESGKKLHLSFGIKRPVKKPGLPVLKDAARVLFVSEDTTRFIPIFSTIKEIKEGQWRFESEVKFPKPGQYKGFFELWNTPETVSLSFKVK